MTRNVHVNAYDVAEEVTHNWRNVTAADVPDDLSNIKQMDTVTIEYDSCYTADDADKTSKEVHLVGEALGKLVFQETGLGGALLTIDNNGAVQRTELSDRELFVNAGRRLGSNGEVVDPVEGYELGYIGSTTKTVVIPHSTVPDFREAAGEALNGAMFPKSPNATLLQVSNSPCERCHSDGDIRIDVRYISSYYNICEDCLRDARKEMADYMAEHGTAEFLGQLI